MHQVIVSVPHLALGTYAKLNPPEVPIELRDRANPLRYRNIWIRLLGDYDRS